MSYTKKKRLGNKGNTLGHKETSDDRRGRLQLGAGGAGPGRAEGWHRGFWDHRKDLFFPELEQADGGKKELPPELIICHLSFLQGLPVLRRRMAVYLQRREPTFKQQEA